MNPARIGIPRLHGMRPVRSAFVLAALGLVAVAAMLHASADSPRSEAANEEGWTEVDRRPGRGEQCLVCGQAIREQAVAEIRYRGRTFHVAVDMLDDFAATPDAYFASLQPHAALFDEESVVRRPVDWGWFALGIYVAVGLVFAALCGYIAIAKALAPVPWFFAGLVGNLAALIVLGLTPRGEPSTPAAGLPRGLGKVHRTRDPVPCPNCGAWCHPTATACAACGTPLHPSIRPEVTTV